MEVENAFVIDYSTYEKEKENPSIERTFAIIPFSKVSNVEKIKYKQTHKFVEVETETEVDGEIVITKSPQSQVVTLEEPKVIIWITDVAGAKFAVSEKELAHYIDWLE